jgi:hypothetical protein
MNDADEWARLQDTWAGTAPSGMPDVAPMIARARRQRHLILWTIAAEWAIAVGGAVFVATRWPEVRTDGLLMLWWVFFLLASCVTLATTTWTRLEALREPAGASLRDWLRLRRRRALLGLRLARVTRWSTLALSPAALVVLATARPGWSTVAAVAAVVLVLGGGWLWAGWRASRLTAELAEVDALALEWLDETLDSSSQAPHG